MRPLSGVWLTTFAIIVLLSNAILPAYAQTWQPTQRLTNNAGSSVRPSVSASGSNVYVAWSDSTFDLNYEIFFKRSTDSGATWEATQRLTYNQGPSGFPSVAVSGSNIYVAWEDSTFGNEEIFFKHSVGEGAHK